MNQAGTAAGARESQVSGQVSRLAASGESLREAVAELENRLGPVLRSETDAVRKDGSTSPSLPREPMVGLADAICTNADSILFSVAAIRRLINRLEL